MSTIIAFGHRRYVGKDTCSNLAISHIRAVKRGILTYKTGFSSKMKAMCHDLYAWAGLENEEFYEQNTHLKDKTLPAIDKSPREIWIEFGTTVGRAIYNDTWIKFVLHTKCDYLFIKDLRFKNEAEMVLKAGGAVIRVDNPRIKHESDVADSNLKDFKDWSHILVNDGDIQNLNGKVIECLTKLKIC
jgi:hypothetical protein